MAKPNPVPPYLRVVEESTCVNEVNNFDCLSFSIPIPVSLTEKFNSKSLLGRSFWERNTFIQISPLSVNFNAFPIRLISIC